MFYDHRSSFLWSTFYAWTADAPPVVPESDEAAADAYLRLHQAPNKRARSENTQPNSPPPPADAPEPQRATRQQQKRKAAAEDAASAAASVQNEKQPQAKHQKGGRPKKARVVLDVHGAGSTPAAQAATNPNTVDNEYERQRLERIRRNQAMLAELGISQAASSLAATVAAEQQQGSGGGRSTAGKSHPKQRRGGKALAPLPSRQSTRQRGGQPADGASQASAEAQGTGKKAAAEQSALLTLEEYYELAGVDASDAVVVDDRLYYGWVNPAVCERYGIAGSAGEAWAAGGGGKFSYKIDKSAIPAHLKGKGWSDARAFAATQLQKSPNTYFYRHVAPHEQQAQGEWSEDEHALFLKTARENGAGDKWGLFASHIPQRVGYQCSAYYRDVMLPRGHIIDNRFRMTRAGKCVFVG